MRRNTKILLSQNDSFSFFFFFFWIHVWCHIMFKASGFDIMTPKPQIAENRFSLNQKAFFILGNLIFCTVCLSRNTFLGEPNIRGFHTGLDIHDHQQNVWQVALERSNGISHRNKWLFVRLLGQKGIWLELNQINIFT